MRGNSALTPNAHEALFTWYLAREFRGYECTNRWISLHALRRPVDTRILFQASVSQLPHEWIRLGQCLAEIYIRNSRVMDATMILEVVWRNRYLHGITFLEALSPGLKLAALLEQGTRLDDAVKILEAIWSSPYSWSEDIAKAGNQLAAVYMTEKRRSGALEIWELVWKYWTQNGTVSCREFDVAD